jgi:plastocyanin
MHKLALLSLLCGTTLLAAACDEKKTEAPKAEAPKAEAPKAEAPKAEAPKAEAPAAPAPAAPTGPLGDVKGVVSFTGKAPEMPELKRDSDPFCAKTKMKDEEVVVTKGKLKNVLVRINGAPAAPAPTTAAVIDQDQCAYKPRVVGVVTGQTLSIKNSDATFHNVHGYKGTSTAFNVAHIPSSPNIEKKFTDAGTLLKFKCDVHPWMTAYVWVQNNPWFAVTGEDGSFEIKGVPAGKYEIEAWHEKYGSKKAEVTVAEGKPAQVKFDYTGTETPPAAQ